MTQPDPAPVGVYIHWPYCARICPYCDFAVVRDRGRREEQKALVAAIAEDLRGQAANLGPRRLTSVFFGGGTPSLMEPGAVAGLLELCSSLWPGSDGLEVTLEANPTDAEAQRFAAFADAGVSRLSLGVQALDDVALTFLGRNHTADDALRAIRLAAQTFSRLSLDLIYALPGQSPAAWRATLRQALSLGAEHLSPYQLTLEPGTPFDRSARRGRFDPLSADVCADLFDITQETLQAAGFDAYEVSNHAKGAAARSRHNLIYWRGEDYLGVGPAAHGRRTQGGVRIATETPRAIAPYIAQVSSHGHGLVVEETLTPVARAQERLLMGLRTDEGVRRDELNALSLSRLPELIDAGLVIAHADRLRAAPQGRMVLDRITGLLASD